VNKDGTVKYRNKQFQRTK